LSLSDVKHQRFAQRVIQEAVASGRLPHAYLFHGPDGVGKEMVARGLAQLLLCPAPVDREVSDGAAVGVSSLRTGCQACEDCHWVEAQTHPDLHIVFRQLNRQHPDAVVRKRKALEIGVDVLRHFVIERVNRTPIRARAKVFIIREADRMNIQAQNALLKTLEEPPGTTYLILLVSSIDRLLPTTLSRCQVVEFDALPENFVVTRLAERFPDLAEEQLRWHARFAQGSIGAAVVGVEDGIYSVQRDLLASLTALLSSDSCGVDSSAVAKEWIDTAKNLSEGYRKRDPDMTDTESTRRGLKTILHLAADRFGEQLRETGAVAPLAADAIGRIVQAERQLDLNANTQLCVETLVSDLARCGQGKPQYV